MHMIKTTRDDVRVLIRQLYFHKTLNPSCNLNMLVSSIDGMSHPSASTLLLLCFGVKFHPSGVLPRNISLILTQSLASVLPNNVSKSDLPHHFGALSCKCGGIDS
jgi:hypothetical protein